MTIANFYKELVSGQACSSPDPINLFLLPFGGGVSRKNVAPVP
jgi:hypothetical protein